MVATPDAVDRILIREAGPALVRARHVVVVDDRSAALAGEVVEAMGSLDDATVGVYTDSATTQRNLEELAVRHPRVHIADGLDARLLAGADLILMRLPKSLAELAETAAAVARWAAPGVELYAGGRVKHMSRGMNACLARHFGAVRASLGAQKARVLVATDPDPDGPEVQPQTRRHDDLGVSLVAYGGTFAGPEVDPGSRALSQCFDRLPPAPTTVLDLGSGSGLLAVLVARQRPAALVVAVDDSRAAIRSTMASAAANGVADRIETRHTDRLQDVQTGSVDLVVCNPPFHRGTAKDSSAAYVMFADSARALRPGGELWVVYNSHLPYLTTLRRVVGRSVILAQDPRFTVARAVRRQDQGARIVNGAEVVELPNESVALS